MICEDRFKFSSVSAMLRPWGCASVLSRYQDAKKQSTAAEQPVPKVTTTAVIQQETTDFDEYTGKTEASEAVEIQGTSVWIS